MDMKSKIAIVGMGALGVMYGDMIVRSLGQDSLTFLADRDRIDRYKREGVFCNGRKCEFQIEAEAGEADLLIFAVKGTALKEAMELAAGAVRENTIILSLLNGISSEEILKQRFGSGHIVYCVAQGMDAVKLGNELTYEHIGELRIGVPEKEKQYLAEKAAAILKSARIPYVVEEDILHRLWSKWMLNVGVNQVIMVYEGTYGTIQKPGEARDTMIAAMEEVIELSGHENTGVTREDMEGYLTLLDSLNPEGMPSMRQDGLSHRYSEVEMFAGTVIKKAGKYRLEVPVNQMLYRKVKEMEASYKR